MPTFREDLHLGHKVPLISTDDINNEAITGGKIAKRVIDWFHIIVKAIRNEHIDDGAVDCRTLATGGVCTRALQDKCVTPEKLSDRIVPEVINPLLKPLKDKDADLQNQIDSLQIHGLAVSNQFGNDTHIGISQNTLTLAFNKLWQKLEEITGESYRGISMVVTPEYFYGNEGCEVTIKAYTANTVGPFEHIEFIIDGEKVYEADDKDYVEFTYNIEDTVQLTCNAQILGAPCSETKMIYHYDSFWMGGGSIAQSVMTNANRVELDKFGRAAKDVTLTSGQHIIIVMGQYMRPGFIRADINGVEIDMTESSVTVDGNNYKVFTSVNTYQAGTINVDING